MYNFLLLLRKAKPIDGKKIHTLAINTVLNDVEGPIIKICIPESFKKYNKEHNITSEWQSKDCNIDLDDLNEDK